MKFKIALLLFILSSPFINAQDDLKVKTGNFDFSTMFLENNENTKILGFTYEYEGDFIISKERGNKEKLPHGKGKLKQPEKLEKAIVDNDISTIEKLTEKGFGFDPYFYEGEWSMGKKNGLGKELKFIAKLEGSKVYSSKISDYYGEFKNDLFNGKGTLITSEFNYVGNFKDGKKEGFGKITFENNDSYEGEFLADDFHGQGTFNFNESKESFTGLFENHKFKKGKYSYRNGNVYEGEFFEGQPKGKGKFTLVDGSYFEGTIIDGKWDGKAKMNVKTNFYDLYSKTFEFTGTYEGMIIRSKPEGNGNFTSNKLITYENIDSNGNEIKESKPQYVYSGSWKNGIKNGYGKLITYIASEQGVDFSTYEGEFKNDLYDGENSILKITYDPIGTFSYTGKFISGKFSGYGKLESVGDGISYSYEGQFSNGDFHGEGIYKEENGYGKVIKKGTFENSKFIYGIFENYSFSEKPLSIYNGSFENDIESGKGKIEYFGNFDEESLDWSENKVKSYDGEWSNGLPNGQGILIYKNGTSFKGNFRDGKPVKSISLSSVKIGNQTWMAENLTVTRFRNGEEIPEAKSKAEWETASRNGTPAFCYYNNDPSTAKTYGIIYNYFAVTDQRGLAPEGWRIPDHKDIDELNNFEFPYLKSDIKTIQEKYSQGIDVKLMREKLFLKYKIDPKTKFSVMQFSKNNPFVSRNLWGEFNLNSILGREFWTRSNYDNNGRGAKLIFESAPKQIKVLVPKTGPYGEDLALDKLETNSPIRYMPEDKGHGLPVRCIKD